MSRLRMLVSPHSERPDPVIFMIGFLLAFEASMYAAVTPVLPHYAHILHASKPAIGVLAAAYPAGVLPGSALGGWLAGRIGMRRTTLLGLLVFAIAVAAFGLAHELLMLDLLRLVAGIGCGFIWSGGLTWAIAVAPRERRGAVVGSVIGAAIFGTLLGPLVGLVAVAVGTGPVFGAVGAIALAMAAWVGIHHEPATATPERGAPVNPFRAARLNRGLRIGVMMVLLDSATIGMTNALLPLRLSRLGAPTIAIGGAFVLASGLATLLSPVIGRATDRRGAAVPMTIGLAASAGLLAIVAVPQAWIATAILTVVVLGGPLTAFTIPAVSMMADSAEQAGLTLVVATTSMNVAYAIGETVGAPVAAGISQASFDAVPLLGLSALMLLALAAVRRVALTRPQSAGRSAGPAPAEPDVRAPAEPAEPGLAPGVAAQAAEPEPSTRSVTSRATSAA